MGNARRMFEEFKDEEGAAAQLSETILLNSETVFENKDLLEKLKLPVREAGVTVIVQCRDKKELTDITLRNIVNQRVPAYIPWEIIFADNTNSESIEEDAERSWKKYRSKIPFSILDLQGKSLFEARKEAVEKATYNFIVFCNPGNLLNINYVEEVSLKMLQNRKAGALGGLTEATSKIKLPGWFESNSENVYQCGRQFKLQGDISDTKGYLWSAGLAIRKESWNTLLKKDYISDFKNDYKDLSLLGFDRMMCRDFKSNGWHIVYNEDLALKNYLSESELSWNHLRKLYRQSGKDKALLVLTEKNSGKNQRKLLQSTVRNLRKFKRWKLHFPLNETLKEIPIF
ncbi:MAG: glycosyltransferase [Ignavibacteria bacterium]